LLTHSYTSLFVLAPQDLEASKDLFVVFKSTASLIVDLYLCSVAVPWAKDPRRTVHPTATASHSVDAFIFTVVTGASPLGWGCSALIRPTDHLADSQSRLLKHFTLQDYKHFSV